MELRIRRRDGEGEGVNTGSAGAVGTVGGSQARNGENRAEDRRRRQESSVDTLPEYAEQRGEAEMQVQAEAVELERRGKYTYAVQ